METLFCTLQPLPRTPRVPMYTFCPRTQPSPMRAPDMTWLKCQIFVPAPIWAPLSMTAVSWAKYCGSATVGILHRLLHRLGHLSHIRLGQERMHGQRHDLGGGLLCVGYFDPGLSVSGKGVLLVQGNGI